MGHSTLLLRQIIDEKTIEQGQAHSGSEVVRHALAKCYRAVRRLHIRDDTDPSASNNAILSRGSDSRPTRPSPTAHRGMLSTCYEPPSGARLFCRQ